MRIFDTVVQKLKHKVLCALIRNAYEGCYEDVYLDIPKQISPGPHAEMRCCVYKERAVLQERIRLALGDGSPGPAVIDIACDECPAGGIYITESCRGCITHKCRDVCPVNAIKPINKKEHIDKSLCIECGKCIKACPFNAIVEQKRPCVTSCKVNAVSMDKDKKAVIDYDKCIACGACIVQCPFGAISDRSYVMDAVKLLKEKQNNKVYALLAPAFVSQFKYAKTGQVVAGIYALGFDSVVEAAMGADAVVKAEAEEFRQKGKLLTSCCPSFVMYLEKYFPDLCKHISHSLSPMVVAAKMIKEKDPLAKVVFIGPCLSKKAEYKMEKTQGAVDAVLSFEELQAFFDARDIDIAALDERPLEDATYYGRIFARSGGICEGIVNACSDVNAVAMNGIDECKVNMLKLRAKRTEINFFEGMICEGGCVNGPLCPCHGEKAAAADIDKHAASAKKKETF